MHEDAFRNYVANGNIPVRSTADVDWTKLTDLIAFSRTHRDHGRKGARHLRQLLTD